MKKVYIVFYPADDPYAGGDYIIELYSSYDLAQAHVDEYNRDKKYDFEKLFFEEFEVEDGKDN